VSYVGLLSLTERRVAKGLLDINLHPYQQLAVDKALSAPNQRWLFNDEMGLGKTVEALALIKELETKSVLILCPALVRETWLREIIKWGIGRDTRDNIYDGTGMEVGVIRYGSKVAGLSIPAKQRATEARQSSILACSYSLVGECLDLDRNYDLIILDEIHLLQSIAAKWSVMTKELVRQHKGPVVGLTGTLAPDRPKQMWNPLDIIWPGRFGTQKKGYEKRYRPYSFCNRYMNWVPAYYNGELKGGEFKGINKEYADELRERIGTVSTRATKKEWAHILPAIEAKQIVVQPAKPWEVSKDFSDGSLKDQSLRAVEEKLPHIKAWTSDMLQYSNRICIAVYHIQAAALIEYTLKKLRNKVNTYLIDGDVPIPKRHETIAEALANPLPSILICTQKSLKVGINTLVDFDKVLLAELFYHPETLEQFLGRFLRLGGAPTDLYAMILEGSIDEAQAEIVTEKAEDISRVVKEGAGTALLKEALKPVTDWREKLRDSLNQVEELGGYFE
jgi:SNF2 family DNA or RNA helicase